MTYQDEEYTRLRIKWATDPLKREIADLRRRLLSAAGDDLCQLTPEEIKAYTSGTVKIPPKEQFVPSCERFWSQCAKEFGVMEDCLTLAQLIAENERLKQERDEAREAIQVKTRECQEREEAARNLFVSFCSDETNPIRRAYLSHWPWLKETT